MSHLVPPSPPASDPHDAAAASGEGAPADEAPPHRTRRFLVIAVLYLVTDIGFAFFLGAVTTIMLAGGVAPETVGLVTLIGLVYFLRFLIGPVVDRFGSERVGHYRGWILATQAALVVALAALAFVDPVHDLGLITVAIAVVLVLSAFHDAAVNGLTVRLLHPSERGIGNGIQIAAATGSAVIGTGGALLVHAALGWGPTVLVLAAVFVVPLVVLAWFREPASGLRPERIEWSAIAGFFRLPGRGAFVLLVIPALCLGPYLITAVQSAMLLDAGWSSARVGVVLGTIAPLLGMAAGLGAGAAIGRWGRVRVLPVIGLAYAIAILGSLPLAASLGWDAVDVAASLLVQATYAAAGTWVYTIAMDNSRPEFAATDFSLQVSVIGLLRIAMNSAGLVLLGVVGAPVLVVVSAVLTVVGVAAGTGWARRRASD